MDLRTKTKAPSRATKWLRVLLTLVGIGVSAVTHAGTVTYVTERNAYRTQSYVNQGEGVRSAYGVWAPGISDTDRTEAINKRSNESVALSCPNGTCE
jgi:hypothetical protein